MTQPDRPSTRRDFIKLAANSLLSLGAALTIGGLARFFSFQPDPPRPVEYDLGPAKEFPPGSSTVLLYIPAVIKNDGQNFTAFSLKCTHLGCTVEKKNDVYVCPCHGSRYDHKGAILRGPAGKPLRQLRVEKTADGDLKLFV